MRKRYPFPWSTLGYLVSSAQVQLLAYAREAGFFIQGYEYVYLLGLFLTLYKEYGQHVASSSRIADVINNVNEKLGLDRPHPDTARLINAITETQDQKTYAVVSGHPLEHANLCKSINEDKFTFAEDVRLDHMVAGEFAHVLEKMKFKEAERKTSEEDPSKEKPGVFQQNLNSAFVAASGGIGKHSTAKYLYKDFPVSLEYANPLHPLRVARADGSIQGTLTYLPEYKDGEYSSDVGVIGIGPNPMMPTKYCLTFFGSHAYGTYAAGKAITLSRFAPFDLADRVMKLAQRAPIKISPECPKEYTIGEISKEPLRALTDEFIKREPKYCYVVIKAEIEGGIVKKIIPYNDNSGLGWGPFWTSF